MKRALVGSVLTMAMLCWGILSQAQQTTTANVDTIVPTLVKYSGSLSDINGKPLSGVVGATFLLYKEEQGGTPLWMETQNVTLDKNGHYTAVLGSTSSKGLPTDLFASGEARWLAVQAQGQAEQSRVLLVSVPYALKAGDAQTVGGLPASAFVLATPAVGSSAGNTSANTAAAASSGSVQPPASSDVTTTGGTANAIPMFTTATNVQNSILTQVGTTTVNVVGKLNLPASGAATATKGYNSRPETMVASVFNSGTSTAVPQTFQLQAEPADNDTSTASGTLNLLYGSGTAAPTETGLKISNKGLIAFSTGQTFPGAGTLTGVTTASGSGLTGGGNTGTLNLKLLGTCSTNQILKWNGTGWACAADANSGGTVTSVGLSAPTSDFKVTGSPVTTTGKLNLAWNVAPTNANTANAIVKRDASGNFNASTIGANTMSASTVVASQFLEVEGTAVVASADNGSIFQSTAESTSGAVIGVEGDTFSSDAGAMGVYGNAPSTSSCCAAIGVEGFAGRGIGVYGVISGASSTGDGAFGDGAGVWGDSGAFFSPGVLATADDKQALVAVNNSPSGYATAFFENDDNTSVSNAVLRTESPNFGGSCVIDQGGNLTCTGGISAVAPLDSGKRKVALYAIEGPENWFEDAGSGHLSNGVATITLEPVFAQTVNTDVDYHVFLTPNGDCKGLYVTRKSATSFEVHELGGGTSSLDFDYRVLAKRKGFENLRLADTTKQFEIRDHLPRKSKGVTPIPGRVSPRAEKTAAELMMPARRSVDK